MSRTLRATCVVMLACVAVAAAACSRPQPPAITVGGSTSGSAPATSAASGVPGFSAGSTATGTGAPTSSATTAPSSAGGSGSATGSSAVVANTLGARTTNASFPAVGMTWSSGYYYPPAGETASIKLPFAGPWVIDPSFDNSWKVVPVNAQTVDPGTAALAAKFPNATTCIFNDMYGPSYAFYSTASNAIVEYGVVATDSNGKPKAQVFPKPLAVVPLNLTIGEKRKFTESSTLTSYVTAIAQSSVKTPAGTFKNALLVRLDNKVKKTGANAIPRFLIFAPNLGLVAEIDPAPASITKTGVGQAVDVHVVTHPPSNRASTQ